MATTRRAHRERRGRRAHMAHGAHRTRRAPRWWVWLAGLVLVGVWLGWCGALALAARSDLAEGMKRVKAARDVAPGVATLKGESIPQLRQARESFHLARTRTTSAVVAPATVVPVLGRQLRSVRALSRSAERLTGVGIETATAAAAELERPETSGNARVELAAALSRIAGDGARKLEGVDLGPSKGLVAPVARARARFGKELDGARTGLSNLSAAGSGLASFLAGPRRYLVFAANNAEMRAGAGTPLSYGVLDVRDGVLNLNSMDSVGTLPQAPPGVSIDPDVAAAWGQFKPNEAWVNVNMTARFPASAEMAARMWDAIGRGPVDGVLFVDPLALRAVLASTGPVAVGGSNVSAGTVVNEVLHDQYRGATTVDPRRRDRLSDISVAALRKVNAGLELSRLGEDLHVAAQGRHLLAWSNRPEEQRAWTAIGGDGTLASDSVMVSVLNRGGSKLDQFLRVDASMELAGQDAKLTLRLTNRTPATEPPYVLGYYELLGFPAGSYAGIATVNLPGGTEITDAGAFVPRGRDGPTALIVSPVQVSNGETKELVARFRLPPGPRAVWVEPSARIPRVHWRAAGQEWEDGRGRAVSWDRPVPTPQRSPARDDP